MFESGISPERPSLGIVVRCVIGALDKPDTDNVFLSVTVYFSCKPHT